MQHYYLVLKHALLLHHVLTPSGKKVIQIHSLFLFLFQAFLFYYCTYTTTIHVTSCISNSNPF